MANFWMSSLRRSCLFGVDATCSGFMEAGSTRSLGLRPMANSTASYHSSLSEYFLTVAALRINWADVICDRVVWSRFGGCIHECQEKLLEQSYTHLCSVRPWCMWSFGNFLHIVHSMECLHVMRLVERHIRTNRLRVHPSTHEVLKLLLMEKYFFMDMLSNVQYN